MMGYDYGPEFKDVDGNVFHVEYSWHRINIHYQDELKQLAIFEPEEARKLADSITLHLNLYFDNAGNQRPDAQAAAVGDRIEP
jgi:hypothetical protein